MKRIENHINKLFSELPSTQEVYDTKLELLVDSREKYEDLINKGMSSVEAEQTIINDLGSIQDWKKEFSVDTNKPIVSKPVKKNNTTRNIIIAVVAIILVPSLIIGAYALNNAFFYAEDSGSETGGNGSVGNNSNGTEDNTIEKEDLYNKTIKDLHMMKELKVDTVAYDVLIIEDNSKEEITISLETSIDDEIIIRTKDDEVKIVSKYEDKHKIMNNTKYSGTFTIHVPSKYIKDLEVDTVSGQVALEGKESESIFDEVDLETVSGEVEIKNIIVRDLDINTVSGSIELVNILNEEKMSLETVSGDTTIAVTTTHPKFEVKKETISGKYNDVRTSHGEGIVYLEFDSVSGSLTIEDYSK